MIKFRINGREGMSITGCVSADEFANLRSEKAADEASCHMLTVRYRGKPGGITDMHTFHVSTTIGHPIQISWEGLQQVKARLEGLYRAQSAWRWTVGPQFDR